jgi:N-methylhydantoinase A/oxoprolinase/acetone carboxylase beta subunit
MALLLGIDTGGTYTDAVLFDEDDGVRASAKSLTTKHDLGIGIVSATLAVIDEAGIDPRTLAMVSLSTTLATNALVEGQGGRVALVMAGFDERAAQRANLGEALRGDPVIRIAGGHTGHGVERTPIDLEALDVALDALDFPVEAFAVASMFAVRNPEHEQRIREHLLTRTGRPVTCSHELSSRLDGPRRAMTSVLNARLLPMIDQLLVAATASFQLLNITAPMMVVRGDGALIRAELARQRPVETILSGPAASLVGAAYLADAPDALVSDIGGTTTDYAVLSNGRPALDADGATVGGFRTMVEAVAMQTIGLGGDSEVAVQPSGLSHKLILGPRRVIPVSLLAVDHGELVHAALNRQVRQLRRGEQIGQFVVPGRNVPEGMIINERDQALLERLDGQPRALDEFIHTQREIGTLRHLVSRGLLLLSSVTPSDAAHVLGVHDAWDIDAATLAVTLLAECKNGRGLPLEGDAAAMAASIVEALAMRSAEALLAAGCELDELGDADLAIRLLGVGKPQDGARVHFDVRLDCPIVALGASAHVYYPRVAELLRTNAVIPQFAEVANAVGAVVGRVRVRKAGQIVMPGENRYRVFAGGEPTDHNALDTAVADAREKLSAAATEEAGLAGADNVELTFERKDRTAVIEGRETLIESNLAVVASGRPRVTSRLKSTATGLGIA